ncbi:MAG: SUMF1/EgtB/PvdO family nonheme iron enzyme [Candidatus Aegiribacteria sp.]|nr:SUMF1/EgtB/PvdO family nonheme iron enzyme [Candidatus Aegiribacteria sp.]
MKFILEHWAMVFLLALAVLLIVLLFDTSWPIAYVYVVTTPTGAVITDGHGFSWETPAEIPVKNTGLEVTLEYPGRVPLDTVLTPEMYREPVVINIPYLFQVTVSSRPAGAMAYIDGDPAGSTPIQVSIAEAGLHMITLKVDDCVTLEDSFTLMANSPDTIHYVLPVPREGDMLTVPSGQPYSESLREDYLIARHEVTNRDFCDYLRYLEPEPARDTTNRWGRTDVLEVMFPGDFPLHFFIDSLEGWRIQEGFEEHPVAGLTYRAAMDYCAWLTARDSSGLIYRLPTEMEWETAALAGGRGPWPWGSKRPDGNLLNLSDCSDGILRRHPSLDDGFSHTAPVGSFPDNDWGLYDAAGNVWEYTAPSNPQDSVHAMGGGWLSSMEDCRCSARMVVDTTLGYPYVGFRLAASIDTLQH